MVHFHLSQNIREAVAHMFMDKLAQIALAEVEGLRQRGKRHGLIVLLDILQDQGKIEIPLRIVFNAVKCDRRRSSHGPCEKQIEKSRAAGIGKVVHPIALIEQLLCSFMQLPVIVCTQQNVIGSSRLVQAVAEKDTHQIPPGQKVSKQLVENALANHIRHRNTPRLQRQAVGGHRGGDTHIPLRQGRCLSLKQEGTFSLQHIGYFKEVMKVQLSAHIRHIQKAENILFGREYVWLHNRGISMKGSGLSQNRGCVNGHGTYVKKE